MNTFIIKIVVKDELPTRKKKVVKDNNKVRCILLYALIYKLNYLIVDIF